jgi:hypothetical protein
MGRTSVVVEYSSTPTTLGLSFDVLRTWCGRSGLATIVVK